LLGSSCPNFFSWKSTGETNRFNTREHGARRCKHCILDGEKREKHGGPTGPEHLILFTGSSRGATMGTR
jgi:hypothetical protein